MSCLGLVPSEWSSSDRQRRGRLTKAGNAHVRRVLIEAARHYRHRRGVESRVSSEVVFPGRLTFWLRVARRMRSCADAQAHQDFRDLIQTPARVEITPSEVQGRFERRAHLPIMLASGASSSAR